ncbi:DNA ligase [Vibrio agarivorans]|uniref:DNA ligase n=1 Tax=Vibrio agarivorans TaxID=153622 RepID=A0ABT7XZ73_9VIBR|nr:DNA ligase [Vibrio agarivorans]MDN2481066.1 DNA ligase [Vibrio agarivorans]
MNIRHTILAIAISTCFSSHAQPTDFQPVMLAKSYHASVDINQYWVSEKLDGIRAYWDGSMLKTRTGHVIHAPDWFIEPLPVFALEGELWAGREQFHIVQTTVLDDQADDEAWRQIGFHIFDMPHAAGSFQSRYQTIEQWLIALENEGRYSHLHLVKQFSIESHLELEEKLLALSELGAEGLMLKLINSPYIEGRSEALLKLKTYQDREAIVLGYKMGKGKYQGQVGALLVRNLDGVEFYLGSGLSDVQRETPPSIGSTVTYRFNGLTQYGKPKYPRLLRERPAAF